MKKVITISREFGAGGGELGEKLAKELGYACYNKELILKAAGEADADIKSLMKWDERIPLDFKNTESLLDFYNIPLSDKLFEAQTKVIKRLGEQGSCVIIGRNGNQILKEYDDCLHVFIHADPVWRCMRLKKKMPQLSEAGIYEQLRSIDKMRRKYCTYYTNTEFGAPQCYDVCLNTSRLGIQTCLKLLKELIHQ